MSAPNRIFTLEFPKEGPKLDTWGFEVSLALWTCVFSADLGYRGQEASSHKAGQLCCLSQVVCHGWRDGQSAVSTVTSFVAYSRCCF